MQLDIMDGVHLRVTRLWDTHDVEPIWVTIDHSEMTLTYHGQDCAELGENLRNLARDHKWIGTTNGGGFVSETGQVVTLQLDQHMANGVYDEDADSVAVQNQIGELVAVGQVTEDDDQRVDVVERLGQAIEMLLDQVNYSDNDDVVSFSRTRLRDDLARVLGGR